MRLDFPFIFWLCFHFVLDYISIGLLSIGLFFCSQNLPLKIMRWPSPEGASETGTTLQSRFWIVVIVVLECGTFWRHFSRWQQWRRESNKISKATAQRLESEIQQPATVL